MVMFYAGLWCIMTVVCALMTEIYKLLYLAVVILFCGIAVSAYQEKEQNKLLQKSPNYITSTHMKNELNAWFLAAQNSNMNCNSDHNNNCDAYLIANDFTTLTNQQIEYINKGKVFNSICTVGFDANKFYKQFPNYIGANGTSSVFTDSVHIILNGPSKLGGRDFTMLLFKEQFTKNCNLLYKSGAQ